MAEMDALIDAVERCATALGKMERSLARIERRMRHRPLHGTVPVPINTQIAMVIVEDEEWETVKRQAAQGAEFAEALPEAL